MLAQRHPDLFATTKEAEHVLTDASIPRFPNRILIGKRGIEGGPEGGPALVEIRYRTAHQKGGKNRKAWVYPDTDPAAILSAIHGEPISLMDHAEAPQQTEAAPPSPPEAEAPQAAKDADPPPIPDPDPIAPETPAVAPTAAPQREHRHEETRQHRIRPWLSL